MKCSFAISDFLEEIPSLSHSVVFLYFFALIAEEGFLISSCCSLELCIQMFISFLLLLTNDDGIYAPGIAALKHQIQTLGQITVVAPDIEQSGVGHSITFSHPLRIR